MSTPDLSRHDADFSWQSEASCRNVDAALFFPNGTSPALYELGKLVCATCPVRRECLNYALAIGRDLDGLWGGTTQDERRVILRERRRDKRRSA